MKRSWLIPIGLLLVCFGLLVLGMPRISLTFDEPSHLASGYAALARGVDGLWTMDARGHPLLIDAWDALPLYAGNSTLRVEDLPGWESDYKLYVRSFIGEIGTLQVSEIAGRVPTALLTILLAATVYRWGEDLTHGRAGWIGLAILVFDPNILAHGRLATNDVGVTALGTLGLYLTWRNVRSSHRMWPVLTGFVLGLTCLAKSSGMLWLASVGLYMVGLGVKDSRDRRHRLLQALLIGLIALLTIWAPGTVPLANTTLPDRLRQSEACLCAWQAENGWMVVVLPSGLDTQDTDSSDTGDTRDSGLYGKAENQRVPRVAPCDVRSTVRSHSCCGGTEHRLSPPPANSADHRTACRPCK